MAHLARGVSRFMSSAIKGANIAPAAVNEMKRIHMVTFIVLNVSN